MPRQAGSSLSSQTLGVMSRAEQDHPSQNSMQQTISDLRTHFVVVSMGTAGDMYPFLGVALALQRRGHAVTFLGPAVHEHYAQGASLPFHALVSREQYLAAVNDPDLWNPRKGFGVVWRSMRDGLKHIPDFVTALPKEQRCVLLVHPLALPAAALARAERPDIRIVGAYLAPANLRTCHDPLTVGPLRIPHWVPMRLRHWLWSRIDARILDPVSLPDLNAARQAKGLPPVAHLIEHMHSVADHSVTLFPSWFAKQQPDWPQPMHGGDFQLYDPHPEQPLPEECAQFLSAGDAPVVFTPGTGHRHAAAYFERALQASRRLGRRAIFLTMHREQVPKELPRTVLWQEYLPFRALLPRVAALVHHGGIGTIAEALRAGVPQLVVPIAHDQFDNGARVQSLGVGTSMPSSRLRAGTLHRALRMLLASDSIRAQCRAVAARFAKGNGSDALCNAIESA